ncbi:MAG: type II toxin-antitoxin system ParD family antitoxin [Hyphomicrobiales bacterium]|nr:type II toxin-antitoxin system ParD family antitoxin [Hyphomicrobiales bacterium]
MNVSLTPKLEAYIRRKVASGLYNNASEVVREALRALIAREEPGPGAAPTRADVRTVLRAMEGELRARGVVSVALFGSVVRGEAGAGSDIDLLVDMVPDAHPSLVDLVEVQDLLAGRLGRPVDLVTREGLDPAIRDAVLAEAEPVF